MALYEPLRDAFNEMNRMFVDRQVWQAEHERRAENDAMNRQVQEQQMKDQALQREILTTKAAEAMQKRQPKPFSIYEIGDRDTIKEVMGNEKARQMLVGTFDDEGEGLTYSPADGTLRRPDGSVFEASELELADRANALYGIIDMHKKTPTTVGANLVNLEKDRKALLSERKLLDPFREKAMVAENKTKMAVLDKQIKQHQEFLDPGSGKLIEYYTGKSDRMRKRAAWAQGVGAPELAQEFGRAAGESAKMAQVALNNFLKADSKKTNKTKITFYAAKDGAIGPDGKGGTKEYKRNQSFTRLIDARNEGDMTIKDFSTSKLDALTADGVASVRSHNRAVYKSGKEALKTITLPSGMIIPKTKKNIKFYRAVQRRYPKMWDEHRKGKNDVVSEAFGDELAASVIDEMVAYHEAGVETLTQMSNTTDPKIITKLKQDMQIIRKMLGYNPTFELKLGSPSKPKQP